jgi:hypothetical protein
MNSVNINIQHFNITDNRLRILADYISDNRDFILAALVHGSCATDEIINFSDFDGVLIIKKEFLNQKKPKKILKFIDHSLKYIYKFDPLQHHGWFIINESDFHNYPQAYFPAELFEYTKSLYPAEGIQFELKIAEVTDYLTPFETLKNNLSININRKKPVNIYQLKSFLSGMMLMPSLYIQAKLKKGIYKKHSFEIAKNDFSEEEWKPIQTCTQVRLSWNYKLNYLQEFIMTRPQKLFRYLTKNIFAPRIPEDYKIILNDEFYIKCGYLLQSMDKKLKK